MTLIPGTRLGAYEVLTLIGSGGMGEVYRARDSRLGRDVAIKILRSDVATDADRLARFAREAQVLGSLNHPNIAHIYGLETAPQPFIAMELVAGEMLADRLRATTASRGLPLDEALTIAREIADALDVAHERGIVHRDLKPANIALTDAGTVKILDFGLAKVDGAATSDGLTHSPTLMAPTIRGELLGTAPYMSPEQARGKPVDKRSDIWAFGCVLFEMLTGRRAFAGETISDTIVSVLERQPDWTALPPGTPPHVRRLIERCLVKDPKRRLRDVGDARAELDAPVAVSSAVREAPVSIPKWRWLVGLNTLAIVALVLWTVTRTMPAPDAPRIVRTLRMTDTSAQEFGPAISPDGKWVAYYSDVRGVPDVWVKFLDSRAASNLTAALNLDIQVRASIGGVDISPDGALIAFTARQKNEPTPTFSTWVIPAPIGGQPRKLLNGLQGMRWSPDGKRLVAMRPGAVLGDSLIIADADGGNQRTVVPLSGGRHAHWPAWSRDGAFIYFICTFMTTQEEPTELCRVPTAGGPVEKVVPTTRRAMNAAPMPQGGLVFSANPSSIDAGLWWRSPSGGEPVPLTAGVGEYVDTYVSNDGRHAVSTLLDIRQSLVEFPIRRSGTAERRHLTEGYTGDLHPQFDPQGRRLVFSSARSGMRNLWLAGPDARQPSPLTSGTGIDDRPAFSPDGQQIAFVSSRGGRQGIWLVGVEGGAPRLIGEAMVLDTLAWSPDGKRILFSTPGERLAKLVTMAVEDGRIENFPIDASGHAPAWSTTTNRLAYLELTEATDRHPSRTTLAILDGATRRLYPNDESVQGFANGLTAWSPDGTRLTLTAYQANAPVTLWMFNTESSLFSRLAELPVNVRVRGLAWSPNGESILVAQEETKSDIVLFDLARPD